MCSTECRVTFALNSARKSKCFLRSVARMASMTRKRKRLNSMCSRLMRKLNSGRDMKRFQAEAAWWFSKTDRSLYRRACNGREENEINIHGQCSWKSQRSSPGFIIYRTIVWSKTWDEKAKKKDQLLSSSSYCVWCGFCFSFFFTLTLTIMVFSVCCNNNIILSNSHIFIHLIRSKELLQFALLIFTLHLKYPKG